MDQDTYLAVARHWTVSLGASVDEGFERAALQWSLGRGVRNGRVAWQFARDWAGRS
jgi:predicted AAA+ superfamily ATPase